MNKTYRNILMWVLYALLFLAVMVVQTVIFGKHRFFGVKLSLIPVAVACICMQVGHEAGAVFALVASLVWCWTGADGGSVGIVTLTVTGILSGYLCDAVYARRLIPALCLSLGAVLFHEGVLFLVKFYLNETDIGLWRWLPVQAGLSLLACPFVYLFSKLIRKAGDA